MKFTRRQILTHSAALAAMGLSGTRVWANAQLTIGATTIETLSDGHLVLPRDFILGPMPDGADQILAQAGITGTTLDPDCNLTLMRRGDEVILFDVGAGPNFMPSAGRIMDALDAIALDSGDVTHVVFTHGHPDHLWGVLDDFDDLLFYNAQHMMGRVEHAYWTDRETVNTIDPGRQAFAAGAMRYLDALGDQITLFEDGDVILSGVTARMTPGHTPGHMSFDLRVDDQTVTIIGDAIGNHHVALARPDWPSGSDQDQKLGARTRAAFVAELSEVGNLAIGFHMPSPGIGRIAPIAGGFEFVPMG